MYFPMENAIDPAAIIAFPPPRSRQPLRNICAVTEDIPLQLLYSAYMQGIFPWFNEDEGDPVLWYSPEPRFCLRMEQLHVPRSIDRFLKHTPFTYTMDRCFTRVMEACRDMNRSGQNGSWIGEKMLAAYTAFHRAGYAHSIEAWHGNELAGGFYGVLIGSVFCGESMFTRDYTENIARYGAANISRDAFLRLEKEYLYLPLEGNLEETFTVLAASCAARGQ